MSEIPDKESVERLDYLDTPTSRWASAKIAELDAECVRAWNSYFIAHEQAMTNGANLATCRDLLTLAVRHADPLQCSPWIGPATAFLAASGMSGSAQDRETGLGPKDASPAPKGDAQ